MKIEFISSDPHKEEFSYEAFDYGDLFRPANYGRSVFVLIEDGAIQVVGSCGTLDAPNVWTNDDMCNDRDFDRCTPVYGTVNLEFCSEKK